VYKYGLCSVPARSRSAADGISNGHVFYPTTRSRRKDRDRTTTQRHAPRKTPSSPASSAVSSNPAGQLLITYYCPRSRRRQYSFQYRC